MPPSKFENATSSFARSWFCKTSRLIVLAWVNDDTTLRAYESSSDAYAVFRKMLNRGNLPDSWSDLLATASADWAKRRLTRAAPRA